jgi:hypothetical protein
VTKPGGVAILTALQVQAAVLQDAAAEKPLELVSHEVGKSSGAFGARPMPILATVMAHMQLSVSGDHRYAPREGCGATGSVARWVDGVASCLKVLARLDAVSAHGRADTVGLGHPPNRIDLLPTLRELSISLHLPSLQLDHPDQVSHILFTCTDGLASAE